MKKFFKWFAIVLVSLIVISAIFGSDESNKSSSSSTKPAKSDADKAAEKKARIDAMDLFTANDIAEMYAENTVSADQALKDKLIKVTGIVKSINTDFKGDPYLVVDGRVNQFSNPQFKFSKDHLSEIATIKAGQKIIALCIGAGDVIKTPMLKDCELLN